MASLPTLACIPAQSLFSQSRLLVSPQPSISVSSVARKAKSKDQSHTALGSLREYMAHLRRERLIPDRASRALARCRHRPLWSALPRPCHRPNGMEPSLPITPASPVDALAARAPGNLHLQVGVCRWRHRVLSPDTLWLNGQEPCDDRGAMIGSSAVARARGSHCSERRGYAV